MSQSFNQLESIGRYKILRELGRGGMSVVYLAEDCELEREVAIKCVDTSDVSTARMANRLRAEARLLAQLNHPNIVQLYDVVESENILGLVIEYVGGDTLTQRLKQAPTHEVKLKWLAEIAQGLSSAHGKGIAHCDLKADNVLVTNDNVAKVADFGIAKVKLDDYLEDDGLTRMDSVSGSYFSLSPEQATGQAVDTRTDLFSLGILIHQALIGDHPFGETSNKIALLQRIINDPLELSEIATSQLGVRLSEVLKNLLSKVPKERLYNASDIAELLKSETISASIDRLDDNTEVILTQSAEPTSRSKLSPNVKGLMGKAALIASGFLVGVALIKLLPSIEQSHSDVGYIALDSIDVTASDNFNKTLLPLIKSTLQQSTESTLLSFKQTGLVDAKELNSIEGGYRERATAAGVENIMVVSANCLQQRCDIKIQRRSGELMAVSQQTSFPVASDSLIGLKNAISNQLPKLFDRSVFSFTQNTLDLSEEDYRRYLTLYIGSNSGTSKDRKHFDDIQALISEKPNFIPSYSLLHQLGSYLHRNTGDTGYLNTLIRIFDGSPEGVKSGRIVQRAKILTLLDLGKLDEAKSIFALLNNRITDDLFLSEIESSIAYAENDYEKLLALDRQNAIWKPSINNLYNLATSEFFFGNYSQAKTMIERALSMSPNDPYALDLSATIEMSLGNLPVAIKAYETLLASSPDSNVFSNYGLALTLSKDYKSAIKAHKKAIDINPATALHHLNLADSYTLAGKELLANQSYREVLTLLSEPKSSQDYSYLAQAQAHLGQYGVAVKTLKTANKKFPNIAELDYAASIVNTLAGNYVAAIVDVSDAIDRGTAPIWFSFEWFKPLCKYEGFNGTTGAATYNLCN